MEESNKEVMLVAVGGPMDGTEVPAGAFEGIITVGGYTGVYLDEGKRLALYKLGETELSYEESLSVYEFIGGPMADNSFAVRNPPAPNSLAFCQLDKGPVTSKCVSVVAGGPHNPVDPKDYPLFGYMRLGNDQALVFFALLKQENFDKYTEKDSPMVNKAIHDMGLTVCTHKPDILILPTSPVHVVERNPEYEELTNPPEADEGEADTDF